MAAGEDGYLWLPTEHYVIHFGDKDFVDNPLRPGAETADALERLGARMWANAMALLPHAATACGIGPRPRLPIRREPADPS
jgi:hypothetical protein